METDPKASQSEHAVDASGDAVIRNVDDTGAESVNEFPAPATPLPLGWTKVKRRSNVKKETSSGGVEMEWCCDDPSCKLTSPRRTRGEQNSRPKNVEVYNGQAIICLHELDSSWFQGYFLPAQSKKPWGLLAVQEELDECLECADGGYRRVAITAFPWMDGRKKQVTWEQIECFGGDMVKLDGGSDISMETHQLLTGVKAVPFVEKYFGSIVDAARSGDGGETAEESRSVMELLPDVAVVIGPMRIELPLDGDDNQVEIGVDRGTKSSLA